MRKGQTTPDSVKAKISDSLKGHKVSPEAKLKMSRAKMGIPKSEQTRLRMSLAKQRLLPFEWHLVSPEGKEFKVTSLSAFCKERGLDLNKMWGLSSDQRKEYLGWECTKIPKER